MEESPARWWQSHWVCVTLGEIPHWRCAQRGWLLALWAFQSCLSALLLSKPRFPEFLAVLWTARSVASFEEILGTVLGGELYSQTPLQFWWAMAIWALYTKANINALNLMWAAIGSQCKLMNRGVTCVLFGSLKINLAAAFWINCRCLMELAGRPAKRALQ